MTEEQDKSPAADGGYTSVVYFHGMGEQRRYEELSRLIDVLDGYAYWSFRTANRPMGTLQKIHARIEPPNDEQKSDVSYVRVYHTPAGKQTPKELRPFRFYEVYWAPVTAGGHSAFDVIRWLLRQILTPFAVVFSPWRERQRQRRASLHSLWEKMRHGGYGEFHATNFAQLLNKYNEFERLDSRRELVSGSFADFKKFLKEANSDNPDRLILLIKLANLWFWEYLFTELFTLFVLLSLGLSIFLGFGGLLLLVTAVTDALTSLVPKLDKFTASAPIGKIFAWGALYGREHLLEITLALVSVLGIGSFLRNYLGDVQIWSTYQETDVNYQKRQEIIDKAVQLLKHVLADSKCQRVVVIAHSLGTAIAIDALLDLGKFNRARKTEAPMFGPIKLEKLDHVVTFGSPIDKIHYFFESHADKHHRYNRVVDEVRGDIGEVPFAKNRKPHIHWINFWDIGDVISGPLETPSNPRNPWLRVDNVRVQSYRFPDPVASHSAYFEHSDVIGHLFEIIFEGKGSLRGFSSEAKDEKELEQQFLGPGTVETKQRLVQVAVLAVPWMIAVIAMAYASGIPQSVVTPFFWLTILLVVGLVLSWLSSRASGHLKPMKLNVSSESAED